MVRDEEDAADKGGLSPDVLFGEEGAGSEQALADMFTQHSPRELYRMQTHRAAELERARQFPQAQRLWLMAATYAYFDIDRHWCDARAAWCGRQTTRHISTMGQ